MAMQDIGRELNDSIPHMNNSVTNIITMVTNLDGKVAITERRRDDTEAWIEDMKDEMIDMHDEAIAEAKKAASSTLTLTAIRRPRKACTSTATSSKCECRPRVCHITGLAQSGAGDNKKLTKEACAAEQKRFAAIKGDESETSTRWLQPLMRNRAISFEVLAAEAWSAKQEADKMDMRLAGVARNQCGDVVRCRVETST